MAEYDLDLAAKFCEAANLLLDADQTGQEAHRAALYMSLLASELALKAFLEKAGIDIAEIRKCSHSHDKLLKKLGKCEIPTDHYVGERRIWKKATYLRSISVGPQFNATMGSLLTAELVGASGYPNNIRYGEKLTHFPAPLILKAAQLLIEAIREYWQSVRLSSP